MGNTCYRNINAYYITLPPKNRFKTARDACVFMCYTIHLTPLCDSRWHQIYNNNKLLATCYTYISLAGY